MVFQLHVWTEFSSFFCFLFPRKFRCCYFSSMHGQNFFEKYFVAFFPKLVLFCCCFSSYFFYLCYCGFVFLSAQALGHALRDRPAAVAGIGAAFVSCYAFGPLLMAAVGAVGIWIGRSPGKNGRKESENTRGTEEQIFRANATSTEDQIFRANAARSTLEFGSEGAGI